MQYQFVLPDEAAENGLTEILEAVSRAGKGSFLAVLKRFGAANQNLLSFPRAGLTLTLDFKYETSLLPLLDELDAMVLAHGGRIYLAKDARMSEAVFKQSYPNWEAFIAIKDRVDPDGLFASMQSNRLGLSCADMGSSTT
jgi:FAD/FMN-containing dehydrogenase